MSLINFSSRKAAFQLERIAQRGRVSEASRIKHKLAAELGLIVDCFDVMLECGVAQDAIAESLAGLIDAVSNADWAANTEIDAAGQTFDEIDLTEARALLAKVRK